MLEKKVLKKKSAYPKKKKLKNNKISIEHHCLLLEFGSVGEGYEWTIRNLEGLDKDLALNTLYSNICINI